MKGGMAMDVNESWITVFSRKKSGVGEGSPLAYLKKTCCLIPLTLQLLGPAATAAPPQFNATLSQGFIDNTGQAERTRDIIDDNFTELELGVGYQFEMFQGRLETSARGFVAAMEQYQVEGLSRIGGGGTLGLNWRLTNSPLPPTLRVALRFETEDYDFQQRDSDIYTGSIEFGMNFGPRTVVSVGGKYRDRRARSEVFDINQWSGFLSADVDIGLSWNLSLRAEHIDGDVWSTVQTAPPNGPPVDDIFNLIAASIVLQRDDAFNDALAGEWFVYRLPAERQEYSLNLTRNLGERFKLNFEWLEVRVHGALDNDYDNRVLQASLGFQF